MKRVGQKRMSTHSRQRSIVIAIAEITISQKRKATLSSIAKELGLTPSSYLLSLLKSMAIEDKLTFHLEQISQNRVRYCWNVIVEKKSGCDLPWECNNCCVYQTSLHVCLGASGERIIAVGQLSPSGKETNDGNK